MSNIILHGQEDTFSYRIDTYENLAYKAHRDSLFYCKNDQEYIYRFTNPTRLICTSHGCFEWHNGMRYIYRKFLAILLCQPF